MSAALSPSPIGKPQKDESYYDGHFSLSEQATPSKKKIPLNSPTDGIKFMVAVLSLENSLLRLQLNRQDKAYFFKALHCENLEKGGGPYGQETFERMNRDLRFYQQKTVELQLELSKREKLDSKQSVSGPVPPKEKNPVLQHIHDVSISRDVSEQRHQSYYTKRVFAVRNRSLLFHSIVFWLDLSRVMHVGRGETDLLKSLAFSKWRLRCRFKVPATHRGVSRRGRSRPLRSGLHEGLGAAEEVAARPEGLPLSSR